MANIHIQNVYIEYTSEFLFRFPKRIIFFAANVYIKYTKDMRAQSRALISRKYSTILRCYHALLKS